MTDWPTSLTDWPTSLTDWPTSLTVGPISSWPGRLRSHEERRATPFSAKLTDTITILNREISQLVDTRAQQHSAELLVAIPAGRFRLDGKPYADAKPEHPGVIFSLDSRHGHLSYPCDTFNTWQDNLRAIALALEALRKVDRYGVTKHGEQYRGFLALESTAAPAGFASADDAYEFIWTTAGSPSEDVLTSQLLRRAQRRAHPDTGGDPTTFQRVSLTETKLREENRL